MCIRIGIYILISIHTHGKRRFACYCYIITAVEILSYIYIAVILITCYTYRTLKSIDGYASVATALHQHRNSNTNCDHART